MGLDETVAQAVRVYVDVAYPDGLPQKIRQMVTEVLADADAGLLLGCNWLEMRAGRYKLRLGNRWFAHMKLTFVLENGQPVFYVNSHDTHFSVSSDPEELRAVHQLRCHNQRLKRRIEHLWAEQGLMVFGCEQPVPKRCDPRFATARALVVDDDPLVLSMVFSILSAAGLTTWPATSVEQAREWIEEQGCPDILLLDVVLEEADGYSLVAWLQECQLQIPTYLMTGMARERLSMVGVSGVLEKPFTPRGVVAILEEALRPAPLERP